MDVEEQAREWLSDKEEGIYNPYGVDIITDLLSKLEQMREDRKEFGQRYDEMTYKYETKLATLREDARELAEGWWEAHVMLHGAESCKQPICQTARRILGGEVKG